MNKLLLCVALLAMSYVVSANYDAFPLPLNTANFTEDQNTYAFHSCVTADGKIHYYDSSDKHSPIVQVWDGNTQKLGDSVDVAALVNQMNAFVGQNKSVTILQCIGNTVFFNVEIQNGTNPAIQLFQIDSSSDVNNYSLPLATYADDEVEYFSHSCGTADGKLYYVDATGDNTLLLQIWDSTNTSMATGIDITNIKSQISDFLTSVGNPKTVAQSLQCVGNNVYIAITYNNASDSSSIELFWIQSSANATAYALTLTNQDYAHDSVLYQVNSCGTSDGKIYYLDGTGDENDSVNLRTWDSDSQALTATTLSGLRDQVNDLVGKDSNTTSLLQCLGKNVYLNLAYENADALGIELYLLNKSASILSFSYVAFFLAAVALLL